MSGVFESANRERAFNKIVQSEPAFLAALSNISSGFKFDHFYNRYALNHPKVSYCQGMSDLASPLLVTMNDEAHAYICFCALMQRLCTNFMIDGIAMTQKFTHLAEGLMYYDSEFYNYLKLHQVTRSRKISQIPRFCLRPTTCCSATVGSSLK